MAEAQCQLPKARHPFNNRFGSKSICSNWSQQWNWQGINEVSLIKGLFSRHTYFGTFHFCFVADRTQILYLLNYYRREKYTWYAETTNELKKQRLISSKLTRRTALKFHQIIYVSFLVFLLAYCFHMDLVLYIAPAQLRSTLTSSWCFLFCRAAHI